ncbi:MAG: acetyl-CoA carboxylase carboxyltransferase subunit alpha [Elusimicrobia bacterium]|nr:acetyl-CoA carboxylase carboxyltransferase subunit alpha [Candidatus Liberimonas magnetica]
MADDISVLEFEKPIIEIENKLESLRTAGESSEEIKFLEKECEELKTKVYSSLTPWQRVQLARHTKRPYTLDYINAIFTDFIELHGDRNFSDDKAIICGLALLDGQPVAVIGQQKGRNLQENMERNFAMVHPEGYRKALKVMKFAEKFNRPIITFIDTPGAYPGIGAEERGQSEAIARNLREMSALAVPVISVIIGEGGSGGALGIGVANKILMLENAYYSVISPEGCAAILFHDAAKAPDAAEALKITATDLFKLGVVDEIIQEPVGGAHKDPVVTSNNVKKALIKYLDELKKLLPDELSEDRYNKFRALGIFEEGSKSLVASDKTSEGKKVKRKISPGKKMPTDI